MDPAVEIIILHTRIAITDVVAQVSFKTNTQTSQTKQLRQFWKKKKKGSGCFSYKEDQVVLAAGNPVFPQTYPQLDAKGREAEIRPAHRRQQH